MAYEPLNIPSNDLETLAAALQLEFQRIAEVINKGTDTIFLYTLHVEPERLREGLIVLADGTDWDPGSGAGFYGYYGGSWTKLG